MATLADPRVVARCDERFFFISACLMTAIIVAGFSLHLALGRSSFSVPWPAHLHALLFFGWTFFYLVQNGLAATGSVQMHRRLGWAALVFVPAMVVVGTGMTIMSIRGGTVPFFFTPAYFLILNPLSILVFAGLVIAALKLRRHTAWHRRLMFCAMTLLLGPAFGRLLPLPFMIPWAGLSVFAAMMLFPLAGGAADLRRSGRVHPAWLWGIGAIVAFQLVTEVVGQTEAAAKLTRFVAGGAPGAALPALDYPPNPLIAAP